VGRLQDYFNQKWTIIFYYSKR